MKIAMIVQAPSNNIHAYLRVSTLNKGQDTDNQRKQIVDAGFAITKWWEDAGVSGSVAATQRAGFSAMLSDMQQGDTLVITMVDRLGRDAKDILTTVDEMKRIGVKVRVLQFDGVDITSSMGKMIVTCMAAMAELERNILIERTNAGIARAKAEGKRFGRPLKYTPAQMRDMLRRKAEGERLRTIAEGYGIAISSLNEMLLKWKGNMLAYENEYNVQLAQQAQRSV